MSHVKEIKQKQELQAKLQLAMNNTSNHVANWLKPLKTDQNSSTSSSSSNNDFMNLPIINSGSGLSLSTESLDISDINTIGEYIKSGKSVSSLNKKKRQPIINPLNRINKTDSKALGALKNKMKNSNRMKYKQGIRQDVTATNVVKRTTSNDSDSDEEEIIQKSAPKKNSGLLIDSKIKKRK